MVRTVLKHMAARPSILLLCAILTSTITPSHAWDLVPRGSDTCPKSYKRCEDAKLSSFCCPLSSTCIGLDDYSSVICCPKGQTCAYVEPITCDLKQQDAALCPTNSVKTTRLYDELPECGGFCCPFGYECHGGLCALNNSTSATAASTTSSSESTTKSESPTKFATSTTPTTTEDALESDSLVVIPTTPPESKTSKKSQSLSSSSVLAATNTNTSGPAVLTGTQKTTCPSFPTGAVLAGFFPGAIFGAVSAALTLYCLRKHKRNLPPAAKVAHFTGRTSNGTLTGISDPIPAGDTAFRTDFLLCPDTTTTTQKQVAATVPEHTRSRLYRTGSRVKSSLSSYSHHRQNIPLVPPIPAKAHVSRQPSTESIRVYTPPGEIFSTTPDPEFLKQDPYPGSTTASRPDTTFTEMIDRVGSRNYRGDPCYRVDGAK